LRLEAERWQLVNSSELRKRELIYFSEGIGVDWFRTKHQTCCILFEVAWVTSRIVNKLQLFSRSGYFTFDCSHSFRTVLEYFC
jgi:hypothetical protein